MFYKGKGQFDYDPDFDDYEAVQDQWLDGRGSSNVNLDDFYDAEELDQAVKPYGYQIVTPDDYQTVNDAVDSGEFYIGDERYSDIDHFDFISKEMFRDFEDGLVVAELNDFFTPEDLLEYWQSTWFRLTEAQQKSFLARQELEMICRWPKSDVKRIMRNEKKLLIVLDLLNKEGSI